MKLFKYNIYLIITEFIIIYFWLNILINIVIVF